LEQRIQPLCGLYRRDAWDRLPPRESSRVMDWIDSLEVEVVSESELRDSKIHPDWCRGVNTPSDLKSLLETANWAIE
jgi:molybdopterin-guanine dinucleotide biosynthesis protein A